MQHHGGRRDHARHPRPRPGQALRRRPRRRRHRLRGRAPARSSACSGPTAPARPRPSRSSRACARPDGGEATVLGVDVATGADSLKPRIGVSLQTAALYPKLTVVELIDLFRSFYPRSRPTDELIDALDLGERRHAQTQELSGGQRQRLAVALALVNDPELVFLDEPTTGLDPAARRSLWDLVRGLKAAGRSVLLTTHYMEEAEVLCDRLAIMDHGQILEMGTVDELISKRFHERAVRFDRARRPRPSPSSRPCPAVSSVKHDDGRGARSTRATSRPRSGPSSRWPTPAASSRRTSASAGRPSRTSSST